MTEDDINKNLEIVGTGQLLFHNKESTSAILHKIAIQLAKCENSEEASCFRMDWKIYYGKKFIILRSDYTYYQT